MTTIFKLSGLHCSSCKELIEDAARAVPGVEHAAVNLKASVLTVEHDNSFIPQPLIQSVVGLGAGYTIEKI